MDFATHAGIPLALVGVLQALPRTALWERLAREGRLLNSGDGDGFTDGVQTHLLNFRPSRPMAEIAAEFLACFDALDEPHAYLRREWRVFTALALPQLNGGPAALPRWVEAGDGAAA